MSCAAPQEIHLTVDRDTGIITQVSPLVARLLGFEPEELMGRHVSALHGDQRVANGRTPWDAFQEFSYIAAHDLRSPMRRVATLAGMLRSALGNDLKASAEPMLDQLVQASSQGMQLVGQLQVFAESLGPPCAGEPVNCSEALRHAMQKLRREIESAKAEIAVGDLPHAYAPQGLLPILFENLLSNAIRYRSAQPLRVRIDAERAGEFWRISVSDNGLGLDASAAGQLFHPFRRFHSGKYSGSGLGLAICRKIVERAGGDIWLDASRGPGTTIVVALRAAD
ncbi:MAG: hypothetical protein KIT09_08890 [Bryobacteraceae bacterium]|nr:hypothetical protein [Bryobacteraceae bacterium]